ncbi:sulfite exporter TauE/SafE family protein [Anaerovorax odorimutans]|uniref:sulfite exporter TauE/SafE family protein n=1 Tax=Anaerovorax odorimutans TaxID=109327 RepID=UPI00041D917C|nr:sulfite exporter TauE/SafE family protein [Anaerovorax odorimutans]
MKLKASYFSISIPLIKENLRRFWSIPVLSFLVYFFSGIFPIMMSYKKLNSLANYIDISLSNQQPFYMFAHLLFPIITSVLVFKYLQGISSVSMMHAMPFTRMKLYNSNFISGLILVTIPMLLNGLILIIISKPVYNQYSNNYGLITDTSVNIFSRAAICSWIWESFLIILVIYAISVFAGIVTGNSLMHLATAAGFNFLAPGLYAIFVTYFTYFLFGFEPTGNCIDTGMKLSPFIYSIIKEDNFKIGLQIYYILLFIAFYIIPAILYSKRKLERATDTLAFKFMHPIISYLITFLGMTALGFYFYVLENSNLYLYAGFTAGTIIFFIIGRMIVKKTPRVFNLKSLKNLGIYALIAILFIISLNFDITGFEKNIPKASKVQSFSVTDSFINRYLPLYAYKNNRNHKSILKLKDSDNIKAIINFHDSVINNKDQFSPNDYLNTLTDSISFSYYKDNSDFMSRLYELDYNYYSKNLYLKQIFESKEFKDYYSLKNFDYEKIKQIEITGNSSDIGITLTNESEISEFLNIIEKDYQNQTYEDMLSLKHNYANASINYSYINKDPKAGPIGKIINRNFYDINIGYHYKNTRNWLKEHGYSSNLEENIDRIAYISIWHYKGNSEKKKDIYQDEEEYNIPILHKNEKTLKIEDPTKIKSILNSYENTNINYNDYYYGQIIYKPEKDLNYIDENLPYEEMGIYEDYEKNDDLIYFNGDNIPSYIIEYFK